MTCVTVAPFRRPQYQDNGGSWYAWYDAPWPVNWTNYSLYLGSW